MSNPNEIVLRQTPGRDATATEIARARGEFRRRPHLSDDRVAAVPTVAVASTRTVRETSAPGRKDYGRSRLYH
jgi:hypothetical protein